MSDQGNNKQFISLQFTPQKHDICSTNTSPRGKTLHRSRYSEIITRGLGKCFMLGRFVLCCVVLVKLTDWRRCCWRLLDKYIATVILQEQISQLVELFRNHRTVSRNAVTFHGSTVSFKFKVLFFTFQFWSKPVNLAITPFRLKGANQTLLSLIFLCEYMWYLMYLPSTCRGPSKYEDVPVNFSQTKQN